MVVVTAPLRGRTSNNAIDEPRRALSEAPSVEAGTPGNRRANQDHLRGRIGK